MRIALVDRCLQLVQQPCDEMVEHMGNVTNITDEELADEGIIVDKYWPLVRHMQIATGPQELVSLLFDKFYFNCPHEQTIAPYSSVLSRHSPILLAESCGFSRSSMKMQATRKCVRT
jgi:hypothetical protein